MERTETQGSPGPWAVVVAAVTALLAAVLACPAAAQAAPALEATVPVEVACPAGSPDGAVFTVEMTPTEGFGPAPAPLELVCRDGRASGSFVLLLDEPGTFDYVVAQTGEAPRGWTLDGTRFSVTVQAFSENGALAGPNVVIRAPGDAEKQGSVSFENGYRAPTTPAGPSAAPGSSQGHGAPATRPSVAGGLPRLDDPATAVVVATVGAVVAAVLTDRLLVRSHRTGGSL